jgi:hypothetical protein
VVLSPAGFPLAYEIRPGHTSDKTTLKSRWDQFKDSWEKGPWQKLRAPGEVKLLGHGDEVSVLAKSQGRRAKEIAIRRRKLAKLWRRLRTLRRTRQRPWKRDTLPHKLGAAHKAAGRAWRFVKITLPKARQPVNRDPFKFEWLKDKLQAAQERDGHYLRRALGAGDPAGPLWARSMPLTEKWPTQPPPRIRSPQACAIAKEQETKPKM